MDYQSYCSLSFNGRLLDQELNGYTTVNVEGRGILSRNLDTTTISGADGVEILSQSLPARLITVHYQIKAKNAAENRERIQALHEALHAEEDAVIQFGDEQHYRMGRLQDASAPPYDQRSGIGTFTLICSDPYAYRDIENLTGTEFEIPSGPILPYKIRNISSMITANRTGFTVRNITTGRRIILLGSFQAGQVLEIDFDDKTITLNGQNIKNRLDFINSDWREFLVNGGDEIDASDSITMQLAERAL